MVTVHIGIGSNLGNRKNNVNRAIAAIRRRYEISLKSGIYETEPVGGIKQGKFYNCVVAIKTKHTARQVFEVLSGIEKKMGRKREIKWGPRNIDLDILTYGNRSINDGNLVIPHPQLHRRRFVLVPLGEIAGGFRHPVTGESVEEMRQKTPEISVRKIK